MGTPDAGLIPGTLLELLRCRSEQMYLVDRLILELQHNQDRFDLYDNDIDVFRKNKITGLYLLDVTREYFAIT